MRIWSIHPKYLDTKGLVAAWREALLARKVLEGKTKGYKDHPQLYRFKLQIDPLFMIEKYLLTLFDESIKRNYRFDKSKIKVIGTKEDARVPVTSGQIRYEFELLKWKLSGRDIVKLQEISMITDIVPNSIFEVVDGDIEEWERSIALIVDRIFE